MSSRMSVTFVNTPGICPQHFAGNLPALSGSTDHFARTSVAICPDGLNGREHVINCVTHSDMTELVCGLVACSILSQVADGIFLDGNWGRRKCETSPPNGCCNRTRRARAEEASCRKGRGHHGPALSEVRQPLSRIPQDVQGMWH